MTKLSSIRTAVESGRMLLRSTGLSHFVSSRFASRRLRRFNPISQGAN
jgi:hypothetical protein